MWERYRESGSYNYLVEYRRALKATTEAYKWSAMEQRINKIWRV